jgi:hypothetical protein
MVGTTGNDAVTKLQKGPMNAVVCSDRGNIDQRPKQPKADGEVSARVDSNLVECRFQ